jgi:hypothetical protein
MSTFRHSRNLLHCITAQSRLPSVTERVVIPRLTIRENTVFELHSPTLNAFDPTERLRRPRCQAPALVQGAISARAGFAHLTLRCTGCGVILFAARQSGWGASGEAGEFQPVKVRPG